MLRLFGISAALALAAWIVVGAVAETPLSRSTAQGDTINLREIGFSHGSESAPVTVIEFSDFGCPFCAMFARGTYPELAAELIDTGMVRWVYVPFSSGQFRNGEDAERAARCAAVQGRFDEMKGRLYANQREWGGTRRPFETFEDLAGQVGVDPQQFANCYDRNEVRAQSRDSGRAAAALQIRATPTFLIGERRLEGSLSPVRFREVLLREHAAATSQ